jgi:hypothetical protein
MSDDIKARLKAACVGRPAKIPWPHFILHDAHDRIKALEAENARLREDKTWSTIEVDKVEEHEDGSATYTFDLDDNASKLVQEIGLKFVLYCAASGVDVESALNMILEKREG